jgi:hypothetical protein
MKGVIIHALLAVLGLGFAYQTWTRKPEEATVPGSVAVLECDPAALTKLSLSTPTQQVDIEPKKSPNGEREYWITTQRKIQDKDKDKDKAKPGAGTAQAEKPKPPPEKPKTFLANAAFTDYLKRLTPLRAQRSLGKLAKDRDKDFGFDNVTLHLSLSCAGHTTNFDAGARAYGASERYVRDPKSSTTYLIEDQVLTDLESAQFKFMQSELHAFKPEDIEEATVEARGAKKQLLHRDRKLPAQAIWVDAAEPTKRNELYNNWFARLARLRARIYLPSGAEPGSDLTTTTGETEPVLQIAYKVADKPAGKLELVRVGDDKGGHYYARTETTRSWVAVYDSAAKEVEQDVGMVVGVEQAPASKTEKPAAPTPPAAHHGLPLGHPHP